MIVTWHEVAEMALLLRRAISLSNMKLIAGMRGRS